MEENQEMFLDEPASLSEIIILLVVVFTLLSIVGLIIYSLWTNF